MGGAPITPGCAREHQRRLLAVARACQAEGDDPVLGGTMISRRTFLSLTGACATALLAGCAPGDGVETPDALDPAYVPDELDLVSADAAADAMIYSFYDRLSVASLDADTLRAADLPPPAHVLLLRHARPVLRPVRGPGRAHTPARLRRACPRARRLAARLRRAGRLDTRVRRLHAGRLRPRLTKGLPLWHASARRGAFVCSRLARRTRSS